MLEVSCSSGTYIRRLAADLGEELGTVGHLISLRRLACGSFNIQNAISSKEIFAQNESRLLREKIIPMRAALPSMKEVVVMPDIAEKVRHGYQPALEELGDGLNLAEYDGQHLKLVSDSELVAIMKVNINRRGEYGRLDITRVLS